MWKKINFKGFFFFIYLYVVLNEMFHYVMSENDVL